MWMLNIIISNLEELKKLNDRISSYIWKGMKFIVWKSILLKIFKNKKQEKKIIEIILNILDFNPYNIIIIIIKPKKAFLDVVKNNK